MDGFIEKEKAFLGLIETATKTNVDKVYHKMLIREHPFGLGLMDDGLDPMDLTMRKHANGFVGSLKFPNLSIENMKKEIVRMLALKYPDGKKIRLRIVSAGASERYPLQQYFFTNSPRQLKGP